MNKKNINIKCSAIAMNDDRHPNKSPFSGILTVINAPSVAPPMGSDGMPVKLDAEATQKALNTLIGMPVNSNYDSVNKFDKHNQNEIIGQISNAYIQDNNVWIEGYLYPQNCPDICASIKEEKQDLGFSYELLANAYTVEDGVMTVTDFCFTGASLLYKDCAAYGDYTQLVAAQKEEKTKEVDNDMTKEELEVFAKTISAQFETKVEAEKKETIDQLKEIAKLVEEIKASNEKNAKGLEEIAVEVGALKAAKEEFKPVKEEVKVEAKKDIPSPQVLAAGQKVVGNEDITPTDDFDAKLKAINANKELTPLQKCKEITKLRLNAQK